MTKPYRHFESLRLALATTFMSGFVNAYTYNTQGGRFAGVQTGNLFMMAIHLTDGDLARIGSYALPVVVFALGQLITYVLRAFSLKNGWRWHAFSAKCLLFLLTLTAFLSLHIQENLTIALLALFSSIQLETFKRMRHLAYANIMMTGNLKNASLALVRGMIEADRRMKRQAYGLLAVIASFMVGVVVSTLLTRSFYEQTLYLSLLPMLAVTIWLELEK